MQNPLGVNMEYLKTLDKVISKILEQPGKEFRPIEIIQDPENPICVFCGARFGIKLFCRNCGGGK